VRGEAAKGRRQQANGRRETANDNCEETKDEGWTNFSNACHSEGAAFGGDLRNLGFKR